MKNQKERMSGAIRSLDKGYGFIAGDDGINYYLHWSAMRFGELDFRELKVRMRVDFEIVSAERATGGKRPGPRAVDVVLISSFDEDIPADHELMGKDLLG